ncbi:MAG: hypothetical protein ACP5P9_08460, partial [Acidimicrobiales bacterium]
MDFPSIVDLAVRSAAIASEHLLEETPRPRHDLTIRVRRLDQVQTFFGGGETAVLGYRGVTG